MAHDLEIICRESAIAAAVQAERDRISGILTLDESKDRPALARYLALRGPIPVETARLILLEHAPERPVRADGRPDLKLVQSS